MDWPNISCLARFFFIKDEEGMESAMPALDRIIHADLVGEGIFNKYQFIYQQGILFITFHNYTVNTIFFLIWSLFSPYICIICIWNTLFSKSQDFKFFLFLFFREKVGLPGSLYERTKCSHVCPKYFIFKKYFTTSHTHLSKLRSGFWL